MITTVVILPPQIRQIFDNHLLSKSHKLQDDSNDLFNFYSYVKTYCDKKLSVNMSDKKQKCDKLLKEFLIIYERIKEKEKNQNPKEKNITQGPLYFLQGSSSISHQILYRSRRKWKSFS